MQEDLERILFDERTILRRIEELAAEITAEYKGRELTIIALLNGSLIFAADLLRRIPLPLKLDCLSVASYHGRATTNGEVVFRQLALPDVTGPTLLFSTTFSTAASLSRRFATSSKPSGP
jgi:hypoxanthine phosphoribosyltransferase